METNDRLSNIEALFEQPVFSSDTRTKDIFYAALTDEMVYQYDNNELYRNFCQRKGFNPHNGIIDVESVPPVAVSVFKELGFGLSSVPKEDVKLRLQSSATSGTPSTIVVDKITAKRQALAMVKVMQEFLGRERRPFLVMDIDPRSEFKTLLGARFAAITGYLNFASKANYFLKAKNGLSYFDIDAIKQYVSELPSEQPVVVFGFTYILYSHVLKSIQSKNEKIILPKGSKIIHIGGWKKLESEKIDKPIFNDQLADVFGLSPEDVIDIYGFTEQMGLNYPDCPCGCKHTSAYVRVLTRDVVSGEVLSTGQEGKLEFISPIPHSYPGNAILTDDLGIIINEPCPYNRQGTRFIVTGRLKKAEVRGCGDILSEKLTFQKNIQVKQNRGELKVEFFSGDLPKDSTPNQTLLHIIDSLKSKEEWLREQPVGALIGLIGEVSKKWISSPQYSYLKDKGLLFLSSWCSSKHLYDIAKFGLRDDIKYIDNFQPFGSSTKHLLKASPRGLVCHWMAGNVQILGLFALVQCIITKNVNLLKVSARDNGVFSSLLKAFEGITYTTGDGITIKGDDLLQTLAVVYFPHESVELGDTMSKNADVRIAWGGREAIESVASFPSKIGSETVIYGPKLSFSVISKEMLSDEHEAKKLARRVSVDVSIFDQTGCASPHNLYIEKGGHVSAERFCELLSESMSKTEVQIPKPEITAEQISAIHSIRGVYDFCGKVFGSESMSWTILLDEKASLHKPVYSRVLFVHAVESIFESIQFITEDIQTIGIEASEDQAMKFAQQAITKGAARFPQIGRMLNFEMPWDGVFLIDRLVKWNTLLGPLC